MFGWAACPANRGVSSTCSSRSSRRADVSRHNRFGFLRLRAEFETSGEIFGCSLEQLRDAVAETLGADAVKPLRPRSALEALRERVRRRGHPDFR
jgi:hypothetical protein